MGRMQPSTRAPAFVQVGHAPIRVAAAPEAARAAPIRAARQAEGLGSETLCRLGLAAAAAAAVAEGRTSRRAPARAARRAAPDAWLAGKQDDSEWAKKEDYVAFLEKKAALPKGFKIGNTALKFVPKEAPAMGKLPMRLTLITLDEPTDKWAATFTSNAFPGAPILVGRERLAAGGPIQAVAVNNKVSNVFPADGGVASSEKVCEAVAKALGLSGGASSVLPSSTGVIGWRLPADELVEAVPEAVKALQADSAMPGANGIMTTDRYPKLSVVELPGGARVVGIAKGAGMIEPNMATMLCYIMTDADPDCGKDELQSILTSAVSTSFNMISVDGDESTSDTAALLCSEKVPCSDMAAFKAAVTTVCSELASHMARNGEGTGHVIRVAVTGATDDATARRIGRAVVNGPLFKCAVAGNDPNVGRLVGKVGQVLGPAGASMVKGTVCKIGGQTIFKDGLFSMDSDKETALSDHMKAAQQPDASDYPPHNRVVDVEVMLGGGGSGSATVLGSDLTKEYVEINADYRS